ncbi:Hypothetical protein Minf_2273 [Methylacidiphilum infernorum V4]|uniref:Uncharacterized protein n=1 Tax=Methylacidiphilum infernorum (isolate V4) TaxID=481448 RepID=B3E098_METI4|nr:Hypothetical protein Minf_2273 [Methylacidiphilum infernorum V4]
MLPLQGKIEPSCPAKTTESCCDRTGAERGIAWTKGFASGNGQIVIPKKKRN